MSVNNKTQQTVMQTWEGLEKLSEEDRKIVEDRDRIALAIYDGHEHGQKILENLSRILDPETDDKIRKQLLHDTRNLTLSGLKKIHNDKAQKRQEPPFITALRYLNIFPELKQLAIHIKVQKLISAEDKVLSKETTKPFALKNTWFSKENQKQMEQSAQQSQQTQQTQQTQETQEKEKQDEKDPKIKNSISPQM